MIVVTRCQTLRLKCTNFYFGWAPPKTPLGELTALLQTPPGFKGPTSKGRQERGREGSEKGGEGKGDRGP